jgi:hypothetical protein
MSYLKERGERSFASKRRRIICAIIINKKGGKAAKQSID